MTTPPTDDSRELLTRLGAVRAEYPPLPAWKRYFTAILTLICTCSVASGFAVATRSLVVTLGLLVISVIAALLFAYEPYRRGAVHITLHLGGLALRGRDTVVIDFDDVDELWFEMDHTAWLSFVRGLRLVEHGGTRHVLELRHQIDLANAIIRGCSLRHVPEARRALTAGESLTFGRIRLTSQGVTVAGKFVSWSELKLVRIMTGSVAFLRRQTWVAWRTVPLDQVPHPGVFMVLLQELAPRVEVDAMMRLRQSL